MKAPVVPISWGELLDKWVILAIKLRRIGDPAKLVNIRREHDLLAATATPALSVAAVARAVHDLRRVNERLWEVEDAIREREADGSFDAEFVALARAVYLTNDERAAIKRTINRALGSELVEEKSYAGGIAPSVTSRSSPSDRASSVTEPGAHGHASSAE